MLSIFAVSSGISIQLSKRFQFIMKHYLVLFAFVLFLCLATEAQRFKAKKTSPRRIPIKRLARNPG